jgi:DNA-binding beta-propeller fold protein YncE
MPSLFQRLVARAAFAAAITLLSAQAWAQIAVSANDGKVKLVDGVVQVVKDGVDTVSLIDLRSRPPKLITELKVPASVAGPPQGVAIHPTSGIALVTAATRIDPSDATKTTSDDKLTVIDVGLREPGFIQKGIARIRGKSLPPPTPKVLATLTVGKGAAGVTINRAGTLALVANRDEGTVSALTIADKTVTVAGKLDLGNPKAGPSGVVITPDGKTALVSLDGESANAVAVLSIEGTKVDDTKRRLTAGIRPYGIDMTTKGDIAIVANVGRTTGDADTVSVIDLALKPPRVVNTVSVGGQTPEGLKISPDGRHVAVAYTNGSNLPSTSPFHAARGRLAIFRRTGMQLAKVAEADVGKWCQGIAWSSDGRQIVVQCMVEQQLFAFTFTGRQLNALPPIKVTGGPAGIRTIER